MLCPRRQTKGLERRYVNELLILLTGLHLRPEMESAAFNTLSLENCAEGQKEGDGIGCEPKGCFSCNFDRTAAESSAMPGEVCFTFLVAMSSKNC